MSWTKTLNPVGHPIPDFKKSLPTTLILRSYAGGVFDGRYDIKFRHECDGTAGTFTEEMIALVFFMEIV